MSTLRARGTSTKRSSGAAGARERLCRAPHTTPIGDVLLLASGHGLCALEFLTPARLDRLHARLARWFPPHDIVDAPSPRIDAARRWLDRYFAGRSAATDRLTLDLRGAPFEHRVWDALLGIPAGATRSYGRLATELGSPRGARAVGAAVGANPVSIIVPCHRAVGSDGSLVNYGGGLARKRWLLEHEARWRHSPRVSARRGA